MPEQLKDTATQHGEEPQRDTPTPHDSAVVDLTREQLVPFRDVPNLLPPVRRGRKPHVASIFRWAERGLKGVKLEYLQVGGVRCTSIQALQRFFERITFADRRLVPRSLSKRQREITRATQDVQRLLYGDRRRGGS